MTKIGQGDKSEVFLLPDGRVLKLFFPRHAALAPDERGIADVLAEAGVLAPRVVGSLEVDGRPGLVFGNLPAGRTLSREVRTRPWKIRSAARRLAELHAAVHERSTCGLASQRDRLVQEIRTGAGVPEAAREAALRRLDALPDGDTVCHNDIHMLNVIVHSAGSMIIDWVLATRGNPLADVAGALLQLRLGEQPKGLFAKAALELGRAVFCRVYRARYLQVRPCNPEELARWELPVAVALAGRREGRMRRQLLKRVDRLLAGATPLSSGAGRP